MNIKAVCIHYTLCLVIGLILIPSGGLCTQTIHCNFVEEKVEELTMHNVGKSGIFQLKHSK